MKSVFSLFARYQDICAAADMLLKQNFLQQDMNVIVDARVGRESLKEIRHMKPSREPDTKVAEFGGQSLFGLDRLLAGQSPVMIPDTGLLLAGGELATILLKEKQGVNSTFKHILIDLHIDEQLIQQYDAGIRKGEFLFWIKSPDEMTGIITEILNRWHGKMISINKGH